MKRYLAIIGGAVVILVLLIVLIASLFGGRQDTTEETATPVSALVDHASSDAVVGMRVRGIINGDDIHREIQITVGRDSRQINIIRGYQNEVIRSQNFSNNESAYKEFLAAIDRLNFTKERKTSAPKDGLGVCPLGNIYYFTLNQGGRETSNLWASTCSKSGNLAGNYLTLATLFQDQVSTYPDLTRDINLNAASSSNL